LIKRGNNKKEMKKSLIAAVIGIIIILLIIIANYSNSNKTKEYNINEKFGIHGNVIEYGTYYSGEDLAKFFKESEDIFQENLRNGKKTYFVYGNSKEIMVSTYEVIAEGDIKLYLGDNTQTFKLKENKYYLRKLVPNENKVTVIIEGRDYDFELRPNENLYFIISEELTGLNG